MSLTTVSVAGGPALRKRNRSVGSWLILTFGILTAIVWVFPLWMVVTTALKSPAEAAMTQPWDLPQHVWLGNFPRFWVDSEFGVKLRNSVIINVAACLITIVLSLLNAVALTLGQVRHRQAIVTACLILFAVPQEALVFPIYKVAKLTHTYGSQVPLILVLGVLYSALGTFLLTEVLRQLPSDIVEAAYLDGAGVWRMLTGVLLPMLRPTVVTLAVMVLIWDWNEYMMPLILLPRNSQQTIPIAIGSTFGPPGFGAVPDIAWGAAGLLLSSAPTILVFLLFQRVIARGITVGTD